MEMAEQKQARLQAEDADRALDGLMRLETRLEPLLKSCKATREALAAGRLSPDDIAQVLMALPDDADMVATQQCLDLMAASASESEEQDDAPTAELDPELQRLADEIREQDREEIKARLAAVFTEFREAHGLLTV